MGWNVELEVVQHAIRLAGAKALSLAAAGFEIHTKSDQSPVTSADLEVNQILHAHLREAFPKDGWLSEESPDSPARLQTSRVWIIDPIDGTKAFIRREPEFCISAALVEEGRPVVAAIYNPSTGELFTAIRGGGLRLNDKPFCPDPPSIEERQPVIALSPWELHIGRFKSLEAHSDSRPTKSIAWALALAASGRIHAVATFEPQNEWDVAAGVLLIEEAGGATSDGVGQALGFNRPDPRYRGIIAVSRDCPAPVVSRLRSLSPP